MYRLTAPFPHFSRWIVVGSNESFRLEYQAERQPAVVASRYAQTFQLSPANTKLDRLLY